MKVEELLPLRAPALLVESVESADADRAVCRGRVPPESPFASGTTVPAFVGLELAAQAAGAHGLLQATGSPPREGYLVVLRDVRFHKDEFAVEEALTVEVSVDGAAPPLALYKFRLYGGGGTVADGVLGTFVPSP